MSSPRVLYNFHALMTHYLLDGERDFVERCATWPPEPQLWPLRLVVKPFQLGPGYFRTIHAGVSSFVFAMLFCTLMTCVCYAIEFGMNRGRSPLDPWWASHNSVRLR